MKFKFIAPTLLMAFSLFQGALADEAIRFIPETYPIGYVDQGDVKHFVLKGANVTDKEIVLENVFGQGVGMSNFKYPQRIPAKGTISHRPGSRPRRYNRQALHRYHGRHRKGTVLL